MLETNLKVRLVGATVLVSLAVIFIPMILDGRESTGSSITESNIPPKPERGFISKVIPLTPVETVKPAVAAKPMIKKGLAPQVSAETPEVKKPVPKVASKTAVKQEKAPPPATDPVEIKKLRADISAWAVQVGSFSSKQNALALRDKLRNKGFAAFVDTTKVNEIENFRVRVGPEVKREKAESLRKKLSGTYKGRTFIVKHPS